MNEMFFIVMTVTNRRFNPQRNSVLSEAFKWQKVLCCFTETLGSVIAGGELPNHTHIWHLYQQSTSCLRKLSANLEVETLTLTLWTWMVWMPVTSGWHKCMSSVSPMQWWHFGSFAKTQLIENSYESSGFKGILHLWKDECVFKMGHIYFWIWSFLDWVKPENVFLAYVDERQQLPECTCFTAL